MHDIVDSKANHDDDSNWFGHAEFPTFEDHDGDNAEDDYSDTDDSQNRQQNISCSK